MKQAGYPLLLLEVKNVSREKVTDKRARRYITITDRGAWEYIDKIMTHPDYDKSFNKVINSALLFGLPELYKRLFDKVEIDGEEKTVSVPREYSEDALYFELVRLMSESIANQVVLKRLVCSIFNLLAVWGEGARMGEAFKKGFLKDTPDFIVKEEARMLKEAGR